MPEGAFFSADLHGSALVSSRLRDSGVSGFGGDSKRV